MNHKSQLYNIIFLSLVLEICLGAVPTFISTNHWPVYKQNLNLILPRRQSNLPAPSPFHYGFIVFDSESPTRIERKLSGYSYSTSIDLYTADINPYAQSLNAELETAFATVASYADNVETLPQAAQTTNNLNVDQSPTGGVAAATAADDLSLDRLRYFTLDGSLHQHQHQHQQQQSEPSADEVYQAKRTQEEALKKIL